MNQTTNGGQPPPTEQERSLDDMLDDDLCKAIDRVEAFDQGTEADRWKNLGDYLLLGMIIGAFFFGAGIWLDSNKEAVAHPATPPETTIGVDPNE